MSTNTNAPIMAIAGRNAIIPVSAASTIAIKHTTIATMKNNTKSVIILSLLSYKAFSIIIRMDFKAKK